jgi:cysteine desulfurase
MQRIYLDANATTPLLPEVFEAMRPFYLEHFGNASSIHQHGQEARSAVDHARDAIARMLHCRPAEVVFTSGGTESDNLAIFGVLAPGDHMITSTIEHHAVLHAAHSLESRGVEVTYLPVTSQGIVEPAALLTALKPNTKLVSIMYANNETGVIQPVDALAGIAHAGGALFHTDAVQTAGKLSLDVSPHGLLKDVDLLTISGHKIFAPKGTGVLYVRRSVKLSPMLHGGSHERQRRAGTENVPGIVGIGKAVDVCSEWLKTDGAAKLAALRDRLEAGILATVPGTGVNGAGVPRVANTTSIYFDHVEAEALLIALDLKGISVSGGSACQSGASEPSHVLTAMGLSPARARATLRFSLSKLTTEAEIDEVLTIVPAAVARLRELSPAYKAAVATT